MTEVLGRPRLLLTCPSRLDFAAAAEVGVSPRSWIQLARTGTFVSQRYGHFAITTGDLQQMFDNFKHVTPQAPTELPVDFDHLSMAPQKPGDGKAAGWLKNMELRGNDNELWGLVEWTPEAAQQIANRDIRFVSPSFVKDYVYKDGRTIGTTLLAAAITNHPFLEGMQAVTLATDGGVFGDVAVGLSEHLDLNAEHFVGRHVSFLPNEEQTPELTSDQRGGTYVVKGVRQGEVFVKLATLDGESYGWFPEAALGPALSPNRQRLHPPATQEVSMSQTTPKHKAALFAQRVATLAKNHPMRKALELAQAEDREGATAYVSNRSSIDPAVINCGTVVSLTAGADETFDQLVSRYAAEQHVTLRQAIHDVGKARPDLVAVRG